MAVPVFAVKLQMVTGPPEFIKPNDEAAIAKEVHEKALQIAAELEARRSRQGSRPDSKPESGRGLGRGTGRESWRTPK